MRLEICIDVNDVGPMVEFWATALDYVRGYDDDDVYFNLLPADGNGATVFLQKVPEKKTVKDRIHLDLYETDPVAKITTLMELGATKLGEPCQDGDWWWQVMADPEGNEFCVIKERPEKLG